VKAQADRLLMLAVVIVSSMAVVSVAFESGGGDYATLLLAILSGSLALTFALRRRRVRPCVIGIKPP